MKKYTFLFLALIGSGLLFGFIAVDDERLKKILQQIEKYRQEYPQEKVHLHLDKPYYAIGDNIWFKAYVVNAEKNQLTDLSKILYVELINEKDSVKQSLRLPLTYGLTWGDFTLSDSLQEGNYRIRAYTTWMRNFGEDFYFDKTITIGNSISNKVLTNVTYSFLKEGKSEKVTASIDYTDLEGKPLANKEVTYSVVLDFRNIAKGKAVTNQNGNIQVGFLNTQPFILKSGKILTSIQVGEGKMVSKAFPVKATSNESDVQFMPESGRLINGLTSKVGFKALSSDGLGTDIMGHISDQNGKKITDLSSSHAGMGYFTIKPSIENKYTAHIKFKDGSEKEFPLPEVVKSGYILSTDNTDNDEQLHIKVQTTETSATASEFTLIAQSNGNVQYVSKNKIDASSFSASLPKSRFPTGILQLTLFSDSNEPVAERLVFINHEDFLNLNVKSTKTVYAKREKVELEIDAKTVAGKASVGSFSVAVTDESKVPFDDNKETTILSNLLLSSDLKGYVESPNYYFHDSNREKIKHLDLLMMTQGWRRFEWKNIVNDYFPNLVYKPERSIQVSGRVTSLAGKPVAGGAVTLFSSSGNVFLIDTLTNEKGEFVFDNLYFNDSTKFIVQARNDKDRKNVQIELDRIPAQLVTKNKNAAMMEINVNKSILPYLVNSSNTYNEMLKNGMINRSLMLDEVRVVEKKAAVANSTNLNGAGNADAIIKADALESCFELVQCLVGRIAGVTVRDGIVYATRNMYSSLNGPVPMQLIVDGMYMDQEFLSSISPQDVETIEVLKSGAYTAIYGIQGGGGVLIVNTKRGDSAVRYKDLTPGILSFKPQGMYTSREFYAPKYDSPATNSQLPDLRTTVYWNPNVVTDTSGIAKVNFFNSDGAGTYKVVIEGLNIEGNLGRKVMRYTVK